MDDRQNIKRSATSAPRILRRHAGRLSRTKWRDHANSKEAERNSHERNSDGTTQERSEAFYREFKRKKAATTTSLKACYRRQGSG